MEGSAGLGEYKREIKLRPHNKAVIGFRGRFQKKDVVSKSADKYSTSYSAILDLYVYVGVRLDIITNSSPTS